MARAALGARSVKWMTSVPARGVTIPSRRCRLGGSNGRDPRAEDWDTDLQHKWHPAACWASWADAFHQKSPRVTDQVANSQIIDG